MRNAATLRSRQRGAVAVMTGLMAVALFSFGGVVLDLGHLYIAKSELQNAADAAALAGAKELNNKLSGITAAVNRAIQIAAQHRYDFSKPVTISIANIRLASCPNAGNFNTFGRPETRSPTCTFVAASSVTSDAQAAGLSFLEVDTGNQTLNTYLMRVAGAAFNETATAGYAVAGRFMTNVTPIGVCAIDPDNKSSYYDYTDLGKSELIEYGFRRGVSYNIIALNPLGGASGTPMLINPVDAPPGNCDPSHSSGNFTAPFVCQGNSAVVNNVGNATKVYVNTGFSAGPIHKALNSRFDDFNGGSPCDPSSAPPDANIKSYEANANPPGASGHPRDWMENGLSVLPDRQTVTLNPDPAGRNEPDYWPYIDPTTGTPNPYADPPRPTPPKLPFARYGALWSYTRPAGFEASNVEWNALYNGGITPTTPLLNEDPLSGYPDRVGTGFPATPTTSPAPYNQTSGKYFEAPSRPGRQNRRVLNVVILDCRAFVGAGGLSCQALDVKAIGKFFMQVPADLNGNPKKIETEFAGLIDPIPSSEIKLFR